MDGTSDSWEACPLAEVKGLSGRLTPVCNENFGFFKNAVVLRGYVSVLVPDVG